MKLNPDIQEYLEYLKDVSIEGPRWGNLYLQDTALREYTEDKLNSRSSTFLLELERLGDRFISIYREASNNAERNPPTLEQYDAYGKRIDVIHTSQGWRTLGKLSAEDGIVGLAYEEDRFKLGDLQRFGQLVVLMMYQPAGLYGCPLAMTDGAAFTLKRLNKSQNNQTLQKAYGRLISRDPKEAWTSGQWMTEKRGGSDVSNTETIAYRDSSNSSFRLYGYKWFTSATDSQMALTLAKIIPPTIQKPTPQQIKQLPLSLFYLQLRGIDGQLNNIEVIRLKDKLGTKQLPTAQLLLKGTKATMLGQEGKGVKQISSMLTVTRIYNSATAVGMMKRMVALVRDYSAKRIVGNKPLSSYALHTALLSDLEVTYRANLIFYLSVAEYFSKQQAGSATKRQSSLLRIMTPLLKLFTGKAAVAMMSQGLECFGGLGYIEGTGLPNMLRDSQVLTIWEGTTNVLCMDFVRALKSAGDADPFGQFSSFGLECIDIFTVSDLKNKKLDESYFKLIDAFNKIVAYINKHKTNHFKQVEHQIRSASFSTCRIFIALLLLRVILKDPRSKHIEVFCRWIQVEPLFNLRTSNTLDRQIAYDMNVIGRRNEGEADSRNKLRPHF